MSDPVSDPVAPAPRGIHIQVHPLGYQTRVWLDGQDVSRYFTRLVLTADVEGQTRIECSLLAIDSDVVVEFAGVVTETEPPRE